MARQHEGELYVNCAAWYRRPNSLRSPRLENNVLPKKTIRIYTFSLGARVFSSEFRGLGV